jgi:hypothetical protein
MTPPPKRRLLVSDVMLLVLAAAICLAAYRTFLNTSRNGLSELAQFETVISWVGSTGWVLLQIEQRIEPTLPIAAAWTVAVAVLRLRPPRPSWRRVLRQPGTTACLAAIFGSLWAVAGVGGTLLLMVVREPAGVGSWSSRFFQLADWDLFAYVGLAVASAWFAQALSGRWRPVPDPIDRLGRILGVYWILVGLVWACFSTAR